MFKRFLIVLAGVVLFSSGVFAQSSVTSDTTQTKKKHIDSDVKKAKPKATTTVQKNVNKSTNTAQKSSSKVSKESLAAAKKKGKKTSKSTTAV